MAANVIHRAKHAYKALLLIVSALVCFFLNGNFSALAAGGQGAAFERVSGRLQARNGRSWQYGYDIRLAAHALQITVAVKLVPDGDVNRPSLSKAMQAWEKGVEAFWSRRFAIRTAEGDRYPIVVDLVFDRCDCHHAVIVRPGSGPSDVLHWHLMDTPAVIAHEVGHMLGCWDEYPGGALAPDTRQVDLGSVMACSADGGAVRPRHFQRALQWFQDNTGMTTVSLVPAGVVVAPLLAGGD